MKFPKDWLINEILDDDGGGHVVVLDESVSKGRWVEHRRKVFKHAGGFYQLRYEVPLTENQDVDPLVGEDDMVECPEVVAQEKTITVYVLAKDRKP